jgi:hypothetical protein
MRSTTSFIDRASASVFIATIACTAFGAAPALAQSVIHSQAPVPAYGSNWVSDVGTDSQQVADNWTATADRTIVGIRWWGSYFGAPDGGPVRDMFTLNVYEHDAEEEGPGALAGSFLIRNEVTRTPTEIPGASDIFRYEATLPQNDQTLTDTGFTPVPGQTYWFSVVNDRATIDVTFWSWYEGTGGDADVVFNYPGLPPWQHDTEDRAFELIAAPVIGDLDGDSIVSFGDLLLLLGSWGDCPAAPDPCPADFNGNGKVGFEDLLTLLSNWSPPS